MKNRRFNAKRIKKGLLSGLLIVSLGLTSINAEAKKNHKPTITFKGKLKNSKKVTINEGERILVKATAKDKEDGNITKKVKVKVKKPEDGEIKKEGNYIRFINDGTYKVTVSVKDSKKKTASLTRTVVVKEDESLTTQNPVVTNNPVPIQTQKPTQTPVATNKPTQIPILTSTPQVEETNKPVETSTPEGEPQETIKPSPAPTAITVAPEMDLSEYGTIERINIEGIDYKFLTTETMKFIEEEPGYYGFRGDAKYYEFSGNDIEFLCYDKGKNDFSDKKYMKLLGEIKIIDEYGVDVSNNIFFKEIELLEEKMVEVFFIDSRSKMKSFTIMRMNDKFEESNVPEDADYIDYEQGIYLYARNFSVERMNIKKLTKK